MANQQLRLEIVTQEEQVASIEVNQVTLPSTNGEITVLPGHQALTATMRAGELTYKTDGSEYHLVVSPGFIQVHGQVVTVLADSAVREEDLNEQAALEAKAAAELAIQDLESESEVAMTLGTIERTIMEMQAIKRRKPARHHRQPDLPSS